MSIAALEYMANLMQSIGVPYQFMRWNSGQPPDSEETESLPDCYFVGEYIETDSTTKEECGYQESTFILRGFTRKTWMLLEEAKEKIEHGVPKTAILDNGSGIAVFYGSTTVVPTGEMELKSIKINLTIQEWKVN